MSDQSERKGENKGGDLLGLFLSGVGGLFFVSILLSFGEREPKEVIWTAPVVGLIEGLGRAAGLCLSAGVALVGTTLFLTRRGTSPGRTIFCLLGAALGLALLLGGVIPSGAPGGLLGRSLPDLWPGLQGRLLGALIGLGVGAASVAALWPSARARGVRSSRSAGERAALAPSLESRHGGEGVSAAEADALTPAPRARAALAPPAVPAAIAPRAVPAPTASPATPAPFASPALPAPFASPALPAPFASPARPAEGVRDVRLEGRIPPGARPLEARLRAGARPAYPGPVADRDEHARYAPSAAPAVRSIGGSLAGDVRPIESQGKGPAQPSWERASHTLVEPAEPWEDPALPLATQQAVAPEAAAEAEPDAGPRATAVDAEAEQPALAEPRPARAARRPRAPRTTARAESRTQEASPDSDADAASAALRGFQPPAWEQVGLFDEPAEASAAESVPAEEEDEGLVAPHAELQADAAEPRAEGARPRVAYETDLDFDDDDLADEDEDEDDDEDDEDEDEDEDDDEDEDEDEDEEEEEDLDELDLTEVEVEASADAEHEPIAAEAEAEPEKLLAPAAPAPAREPAAPIARLDFEQLVHEAGCVVIEQNRVAVSMLQRSFQIDFDQACAVLDQLQERGLIGPYMGGRTRDILLTREEWVAQAPVA